MRSGSGRREAASGRHFGRDRRQGSGSRSDDLAGVLSTAGYVVFTGDCQGNVLALDARTGDTLWHAYGGAAQNGPITYELDGRQYVIYGASGVLYAPSLPEAMLHAAH